MIAFTPLMPATDPTSFILISRGVCCETTNYLFPKVKLLLAATPHFSCLLFFRV
jgi:hypothetical protein